MIYSDIYMIHVYHPTVEEAVALSLAVQTGKSQDPCYFDERDGYHCTRFGRMTTCCGISGTRVSVPSSDLYT